MFVNNIPFNEFNRSSWDGIFERYQMQIGLCVTKHPLPPLMNSREIDINIPVANIVVIKKTADGAGAHLATQILEKVSANPWAFKTKHPNNILWMAEDQREYLPVIDLLDYESHRTAGSLIATPGSFATAMRQKGFPLAVVLADNPSDAMKQLGRGNYLVLEPARIEPDPQWSGRIAPDYSGIWTREIYLPASGKTGPALDFLPLVGDFR